MRCAPSKTNLGDIELSREGKKGTLHRGFLHYPARKGFFDKHRLTTGVGQAGSGQREA